MDDLISRAAAIDAAIDGVDDWDGGCNANREAYIVRHMNEVPAADAVNVVRCKDCKHWGFVDGCNWMTCRKGILTSWSNKGYGYCSYGERMSNIEGN